MLKMSENAANFVDIMSESTATSRATEKIGFDEAFTLYHRTVFRTARSVVQDGGLAEDVTQEVFLRLHKHMDSITDNEMLRPWLIRVAINLARNTIRGNIRANTREENYVKESGELFERSVEIDYEENAGISYKEIASSLELNEGSIGTYVARARAEFARFYGKIGKETLR
jgi:DNA-directed RNA polymerase specialized sigma24 family protein